MKKKWSPEKVKQTEKWLRTRWPDLFEPGPDLKPLSTTIYRDILAFRSENPDLSGRVLREALKRHTTSFGYLYGMVRNTHRVNLQGEVVEEILPEHRLWASGTLKLLQKISKKTRKPSGNRHSPKPVAANRRRPNKPDTSAPSERRKITSRAAPVIRYKQTKRRLQIQRPVAEELVASGS